MCCRKRLLYLLVSLAYLFFSATLDSLLVELADLTVVALFIGIYGIGGLALAGLQC